MSKAARQSRAKTPPTKAQPPRHKVIIVDDHPIVRERLSELLNQEPDLIVCGEAEDAHQALEQIERLRPELAIVDITLKDTYGIELIKDIRIRWPELPVLVLSMHDESLYAERALRAGARGYITKQEATRKVIAAIRQVLSGQIYLSERVSTAILNRVAGRGPTTGSSPRDLLTDRELEIFQLLGQGVGVRQIAETLHVSVKTVEAHRAHIKDKLKVKTSAQLLRLAIQHSLEEPH